MEITLAAHAFATIALTGLIWFVQIVHYPLFRLIGPGEFTRYELRHTQRVTWIVAPLMVTEAITATWLHFTAYDAPCRALASVGLALVAVIWLSTALVQIPCHRKLSAGRNEHAINRLVGTNWVRTVAWTIRAILVLLLQQFAT